ncbi:MAG: hypothetical protein ACK5VI_01820 [Opitutia bacterium]
MNRKQKLAEALKEEHERLVDKGNLNSEDYSLAIKYLETGEYPRYYNDFDLLYGCIEDIEDMYFTYDIAE